KTLARPDQRFCKTIRCRKSATRCECDRRLLCAERGLLWQPRKRSRFYVARRPKVQRGLACATRLHRRGDQRRRKSSEPTISGQLQIKSLHREPEIQRLEQGPSRYHFRYKHNRRRPENRSLQSKEAATASAWKRQRAATSGHATA